MYRSSKDQAESQKIKQLQTVYLNLIYNLSEQYNCNIRKLAKINDRWSLYSL